MTTQSLRFSFLLFLCFSVGLKAEPADSRAKLTRPALNAFLEDLFQPLRDSQPDWLTRLDFHFTKLDLDNGIVAANGGAEIRRSAWSPEPTRLAISFDLSNAYDQVNTDLTNYRFTFDVKMTSRMLPFLRFEGNRYLCDNCTAEKQAALTNPLAKENRRANCDLAGRLSAVTQISDVAGVVTESIADLSAQLSDSQRESFGSWETLPALSTENGQPKFTVSSVKNDDIAFGGNIDLALTQTAFELKGVIRMQLDDTSSKKIPQLLDVYLGALLEIQGKDLATMRNALETLARQLRNGSTHE